LRDILLKILPILRFESSDNQSFRLKGFHKQSSPNLLYKNADTTRSSPIHRAASERREVTLSAGTSTCPFLMPRVKVNHRQKTEITTVVGAEATSPAHP
jgi:hypothetical protein